MVYTAYSSVARSANAILSDEKFKKNYIFVSSSQVSVFLQPQVQAVSGVAGGEITGGDLALSGEETEAEVGNCEGGGICPLRTLQTSHKQWGQLTSGGNGQGSTKLEFIFSYCLENI